jgi:hypothetical protein
MPEPAFISHEATDYPVNCAADPVVRAELGSGELTLQPVGVTARAVDTSLG